MARHPHSCTYRYRHSVFDSEQLGTSCGFLEIEEDDTGVTTLDEILTCAAGHGPAGFVALKVPSALEKLVVELKACGATHLDEELTFRIAPGHPGTPDRGDVYFAATHDPEPFLELAEDMRHSRFRLDPRIRTEDAVNLWKTSLANHCTGFADEIAVVKCDGIPAGMATITVEQDRIVLGIVGIRRRFRGRGLGRALMEGIVSRYACRRIEVEALATNRAACALYAGSWFRPAKGRQVLHLWMDAFDKS